MAKSESLDERAVSIQPLDDDGEGEGEEEGEGEGLGGDAASGSPKKSL